MILKRIANPWLLALTILPGLLVSTGARADQISTPAIEGSSPPIKIAELNQCESSLKNQENTVRKAASSADLSRGEVLARLIFAESLSTGYFKGLCEAPSVDVLMKDLGWGVMNRVAKHKSEPDPYYAVIFARKQFGTSFSNSLKKRNPFAKAFLCPAMADQYLTGQNTKAIELFARAQKIAQELIEEFESKGLPKDRQSITNFFYPHSEYYGEMRPKWAPKAEARNNKGYLDFWKSAKPCVEFYKL